MSNKIKESNITDSAVTTDKIADNAITADKIAPGAVVATDVGAEVITGQTELAEAANNADTLLLHDTSASSLKKITVSNLTAQAGDGLAKSSSTLSVDPDNATTLETAIASGDLILVYDASAGVLRKVSQTNFLNFPTVSSVSPTNATSGDGTGNYTFVITGTGFTGATASLINSSGTTVSFDSQTVDSSTQITGVIAKSSLPGSGEPYDVRVSAASGLQSTIENQINIDQQPVFSTAAGTLVTVADGDRGSFSAITIFASDPESGGDVTYTLESGSLPAGLSGTSTSSGYVISGTPSQVGSNTTSTFTIRASDVNSNTSDREYSIVVQAPVTQTFTSSGTFSVPSGVTAVDVLVVAGGGGGGWDRAGGGGAGGLIFRPGFPVTPGGTVSVTVGDGGPGGLNPGNPNLSPTQSQKGTTGQDSVFGTLTAKGGGGGGAASPCQPGNSGGSGGGAAFPGTAGSATQPTQGGDSGTYGFGNPGGNSPGPATGGGGGGGAGAAGSSTAQPNSNPGGPGGVGRAYTIADGTTSVYYAGGGGGAPSDLTVAAGQGGQGGGGTSGISASPGSPATAGQANTGGGGGGGGNNPNTVPMAQGAPGGKGIVIVRWS